MKNLSLGITYGDLTVPAGTVVDSVSATIDTVPPSAPQTQSGAADVSALTFSNLPNGEYSYSVQASAGGVALGTPVTGTFTVADAPANITIQVPASVSVTLS
jgi:hypothetical protein